MVRCALLALAVLQAWSVRAEEEGEATHRAQVEVAFLEKYGLLQRMMSVTRRGAQPMTLRTTLGPAPPIPSSVTRAG
jgi:hypothetical protein